MDPNECLKKLVHCIEQGWLDDARDHFNDLSDWCHFGGFAPDAFSKLNDLSQAFDFGFEDFYELVEAATTPYSKLIK